MSIVRLILVILVGAFLVWRSASLGISEYHLGRASEGDAAAVDSALLWRPGHPDGLYRQARAIEEDDAQHAAELLVESFEANPASGLTLLALAELAEAADRQEQAAGLVEESTALMPANPLVQLRVADFWVRRDNLDAAMAHWSRALEASQTYSWKRVYPILLALAEEPRTIGAFRPIAASPPSWWERFFAQTARQARDPETVRTLYAFRRAANASPVTREEREDYVRRLQREGKTTEAYLVWVNGLDDTERRYLGVINNGGFEIEPRNQGFGWHVRRADQVEAATRKTSGVKGERALHLVFKRREGRYGHVHQPLFLDPATYRVRGMVRTDSLDTQGGLKWVVRCLLPEARLLGESERFLGSSDWREFSFTFPVPSDCTSQEIRLVSAGRRAFEYKITGGVWFDDLSMRKVSTQAALASSPIRAREATGTKASDRPEADRGEPLGVAGERAFSFDKSLFDALPAPID